MATQPELLAALLLCDPLLPHEAVVAVGATAFACARGTGRAFAFAGADPFDSEPLHAQGWRDVRVVLLDALPCKAARR
jgi:hypothetical protein